MEYQGFKDVNPRFIWEFQTQMPIRARPQGRGAQDKRKCAESSGSL